MVNQFTVAIGVGRARIGTCHIEIVTSTEKCACQGRIWQWEHSGGQQMATRSCTKTVQEIAAELVGSTAARENSSKIPKLWPFVIIGCNTHNFFYSGTVSTYTQMQWNAGIPTTPNGDDKSVGSDMI